MNRRMRVALSFASLALVLVAAAFSGNNWSFDFAQYKGLPRVDAEDEFRFVIVGDRTGGAQWGLMPQTFREINHLDPDFVISVGDLIDGYGDDEETVHGLWDEFDKTEMPSLKVPFVYLPGNHDIFNSTSRKVYEKRYGPRFKSFNYRGLHFICLNTEEAAGTDYRFRGRGGPDVLGEEQLAWLQDDIQKNRDARRILIFMHQPIWKYGGLDKIYPLLEGLKVNIFAGHWHKYSYEERNGIPHIICSATAAFIPEEGNDAFGRFRSYLMATVRDDEMKLALIRLGGVLDPKYIMEQDLNAVRLLADACAIRRDETTGGNTRVVFRNPMPFPVGLQIIRATRGSTKHLFDGNEPTVAGNEILEREVDWQAFAGSGSVHAEYRVAYRFENSGGVRESFDYPIDARVRRALDAARFSSVPKIDGDLSEWSRATWQGIGTPSQAVAGGESWSGPDDLSAQFAVAEDGQNVYIAVRVSDDAITLTGSPFEGDSIEIYAADADERQISFGAEPNGLRQFIVSPFAEGEASGPSSGSTHLRKSGPRGIWGGQPRTEELAGGQAAFVRDAKQYVIELAIPRSELGWNAGDSDVELDLAINDRDAGNRRDTQLTWCGNERNPYSSRYYGALRLP